MKSIPLLIVLLLILTGCATINLADLPKEEDRVPFDPLEVTIAYDVYCIRLDLFRQTRTRTKRVRNADGDWVTKTETEKVPYHFLGVDLGNGLFFDAHKNLSIDLIRLLKLDELEEFTIVSRPKGIFATTTTYTKKNNVITMEQSGLFGMKREVHETPSGALIKGGFLTKDQDIIMTYDSIEYDPHGIFGEWQKTKIFKTENGAEIPGFWGDTPIVQGEDGNITLGKNLKVENLGNTLEVTLSGFFGFEAVYTLMQSENRIAFINKHNQGVIIDIYKDKVVLSNLWGQIEFEIR
jgi:hypothetical protein